MPVVNPLARELVLKIVYYGPGLGGKTTTLQHIHATAKPEHRGKMVSLATPVDRTLYFDFLPIRVPNVRGMSVRLQLFTVPGQVHYNATRKLVLTGADGVVIVFDSQTARLDANLETLDNLNENLAAHGRQLKEVPHVIQYNKRDLQDILLIDELERQLNREGAPSFATIATSGEGVYEALEAITRAVLEDFERRVPESRAMGEIAELSLPEGGLVDALRRAEEDASLRASASAAPQPTGPRYPSGMLRLSDVPDQDPGEAAARAVSGDDHGPRRLETPESAGMVKAVQEVARLPSAPLPRAATPPPPPQPPVPPAPPPPPPPAASQQQPPSQQQARADRGSAPPARLAFSFDSMFSLSERSTVHDLEAALAGQQYERAVGLCEQLVSRSLASAAAMLGAAADAPRDPAIAALLLGLDGRRYLEFRALVREVRSGRLPGAGEALAAYAMAIEVRLARARIGS